MRWRDAMPCVRVLPSLSQQQLPLSDLYSGISMMVICESHKNCTNIEIHFQ